jgi:tripartite motif-containing protein 71
VAFVTQWEGTRESGDDQFVPSPIAVGRSGRVYVVDHSNERVQVFDPSGEFLFEWGTSGSGEG